MSSGAVAGPHQPNILERPTSAVALLQWQQQQHPSGSNNSNNNNTNKSSSIITFCRALDQVLCGGIRRGELTEIAGAPGTGKTALATQLAVTAALPGFVGGVHGSTIYIDTEGSFCPERCHTLASHLVEHIRAGLYKRRRHNRNENDDEPSNNNNHHQRGWNATADDILANIHVFRVHSVTDLTTVISGALPELVDRLATSSTSTSTSQPQPPPVRLIVIDSLAFPHRAAADPETTDFVARTRQLTATAAALSQLAVTYQTAVVAINQMTTKLFYPHPSNTNNNTSTNSNNSSSWMDSNGTTTTSNSCSQTKLVPALGESWAHAVTTRLLLTVDSNSQHSHQQELQRRCTLTKSPRMPNGSAIFTIVEAGVRGVEYKASKKHCTAAPM